MKIEVLLGDITEIWISRPRTFCRTWKTKEKFTGNNQNLAQKLDCKVGYKILDYVKAKTT